MRKQIISLEALDKKSLLELIDPFKDLIEPKVIASFVLKQEAKKIDAIGMKIDALDNAARRTRDVVKKTRYLDAAEALAMRQIRAYGRCKAIALSYGLMTREEAVKIFDEERIR